MACLINEQKADDLRYVEQKAIAHFDTDKDIFARYLELELNVGAAGKFKTKPYSDKFKVKNVNS